MENNNKSQAELYREERKERLAKAAAKNAKKSPMSIKAQQTAKKVISIVLAVVIALGAVVGVLNFFDLPQKTVKVSIDGIDTIDQMKYYDFTLKERCDIVISGLGWFSINATNQKIRVHVPKGVTVSIREHLI